ncbi:phage tail protein [Stenotrophomonas maltophilia]|uniref:Phage collar protein n=1 Tax=Stenotrophomonas maltophilia (strain K279a) TaxID=522373 RepID=B2FIY3_STRMK|nr:phage tail protein [Stenotrophomonas maltophilia]CAQ43912.1 putative phage collar protein [Stenotrophomonas maltophilia K279a]
MRLKFTTRGRAALVNAAHTGTKAVTVTQVGVTERAFTPDPNGGDLTLPGERKRLTTFGGKAVADDVVHLTVRDETTDSYQLRGIGLYLDDGTLLAVYGSDAVLLEKSTQAMMMLAIDWLMADMDAKQIQFGSTDFLNPPATVETQGVVELATDSEAIAGTDRQRALSPAAFRAGLNDRLGSGAPTLLTKTMLGRETAAEVRKDLGVKGAALKDEGTGNGLDADTVDGKHATDFAAKQHRHSIADITDLHSERLLPAGMVAHFPTGGPPPGWLRCNGADVSRTTYADLFAVIGTLFGSANDMTFRLPDLRGEFVRGWDDGRGVDGGRALGSLQAATEVLSSWGASAGGLVSGQYQYSLADFGVHTTNADSSRQVNNVGSGRLSRMDSINGGGLTLIGVRPRNVALLACIKY